MTRFPQERLGASSMSQAMVEFNDFINEEALVDLSLEGCSFTWFRGRERRQCSRIDRFLYSTDWGEQFGGSSQSCLPRVVSDHAPLLLESGSIEKRKSPFRFENMWLAETGFIDWVRAKWKSYEVEGRPCFRLARKLKFLKKDLKVWNREVFGRVEIKIAHLMEEVSRLDIQEGERGLASNEAAHREGLKVEIKRLFISEEISWRQKSRELWLKGGGQKY